jgi:uncharacterized SAM-binding protein YcdF (DUF218 family)
MASDGSLFFWIAKVGWAVIAPDTLLVLSVVFALYLTVRGCRKAAAALIGMLAAGMLAIAIWPVGEWLFYPLEAAYPTNPDLVDVDGVILLSGAEDPLRSEHWNQPLLNAAAERHFAFMALARRFPDARLVFSGGNGPRGAQGLTEARVAQRLLQEAGFDTGRMLFEGEARNTAENARLTKALVKPGQEEHWVLVTTAWHMPRARAAFCRVGWQVTPYPTDYVTLPDSLLRMEWDFAGHFALLKSALREWLGLQIYRMSGRACSAHRLDHRAELEA